jgi:hypothetical protein
MELCDVPGRALLEAAPSLLDERFEGVTVGDTTQLDPNCLVEVVELDEPGCVYRQLFAWIASNEKLHRKNSLIHARQYRRPERPCDQFVPKSWFTCPVDTCRLPSGELLEEPEKVPLIQEHVIDRNKEHCADSARDCVWNQENRSEEKCCQTGMRRYNTHFVESRKTLMMCVVSGHIPS